MTTINCTTLNASVSVNTANVNCSNTVTSNIIDVADITSTGTGTFNNMSVSNTFTTVDQVVTGNLTVDGAISAGSIALTSLTTPLIQVDTIAGDTHPDEVIIQSGVTLRVNDVSASVSTTFHNDIVMDETVPANIHVPSGSSVYTNSLIPNSGTVITCPNEINSLYLSATNSVVTPLLLSAGGPDLTVNANLVINNPNVLSIDNISSPGANVIVDATKVLQVQTITPQIAPLVFGAGIQMQGNVDMNGHNITTLDSVSGNGIVINVLSDLDLQGTKAMGNATAVQTNFINSTSGGAITVTNDFNMLLHDITNTDNVQLGSLSATNATNILCNNRLDMGSDIVMGSHDIQTCNAIQINTSNGSGNVQIHSQGGSTQCNVQCDTNGDLIAANQLSTFEVGLFRPRYWESAITAGIVQTTLAATTTVYSLLGSWGTPSSVGYGWTVDSPVADSRRLTYNGTSSRAVKLHCDMTYSTSAPDQFELGFYKNATISGGNVISTSPIDGSFHRINNTGLTLPRNSFHVMALVAPNDTFMIGVQCATVAGVVFQAISASWSVEDFSNGTD